MGSPPRVRGKAECRHRNSLCRGITPACAGKSRVCPAFQFVDGDHPRVCGEKICKAAKGRFIRGSPPRVRGKECRVEARFSDNGITPACAGKRNSYGAKEGLAEGSPPRVRGKAPDQMPGGFWDRITPACAGKRLKRSHSIGHFSCILCLFHSVLHRASVSGGSRAGPCAPPCLPAQNAVPV